jgi:hypothetical protein
VLSPRTGRDCRQVVERWRRVGPVLQPAERRQQEKGRDRSPTLSVRLCAYLKMNSAMCVDPSPSVRVIV